MSDVTTKVQGIFRRLTGERASRLEGTQFPEEIQRRIAGAIRGEQEDLRRRDDAQIEDIAFHLVDWNSDAAFIVALLLYPEEFTDQEIAEGVTAFLIHAPAHCFEAARLAGIGTENPFRE